jgi:ABC-type Na+ efflux pump permease subunit
VRATSDCISEEKREGTLGLLFLTDLRGHDVVLGKLVAAALGSFYGLLAFLPMLAISLVAGGVTGGEYWRMVLVLTNTLFFSLAIGLLVSAISRNERKAFSATVALVVFFAGVMPAVEGLISILPGATFFPATLSLASPAFAYAMAFDLNYGAHGGAMWQALGVQQVLAWGCLGLASVVTPRRWQDRPASVAEAGWARRKRNWQYGQGVKRATYRRRLLERNPILWLGSRRMRERWLLWGVLAGAVAIWAGLWWMVGGLMGPGFAGVTAMTGFVLHLVVLVWVASQASHALAEARRNGALELMLCTSLTVREIVRGQWLALRRYFAVAILFLLLWEGISLGYSLMMIDPMAAGNVGGATVTGNVGGATVTVGGASSTALRWSQLIAGLGGMGMLVTTFVALCWVGMWFGLTLKTANLAALWTFVKVVVLKYVFMMLAMILVMVGMFGLAFGAPATANWFVYVPMFLPMVVGIIYDGCLIAWAARRLRRNFREVATVAPGMAKAPRKRRWRRTEMPPPVPAGS